MYKSNTAIIIIYLLSFEFIALVVKSQTCSSDTNTASNNNNECCSVDEAEVQVEEDHHYESQEFDDSLYSLERQIFIVNDVKQPSELLESMDAFEYLESKAQFISWNAPRHAPCFLKSMQELRQKRPELENNIEERHKIEELVRAECQGQAGILLNLYSTPENKSFVKDVVHEHGFLSAVSVAFAHHYPLELRPQHIWILILQGVAMHMAQMGDSSMELNVTSDLHNIVSDDDLDAFMAELSTQITESLDEGLRGIYSSGEYFTNNSTVHDELAVKVTLGYNQSKPYTHKSQTECGFPTITLEGSYEDWVVLRKLAEIMILNSCEKSFSEQWLQALIPVLDTFLDTYENPLDVDTLFWQSFAKRGGQASSGGYTWLNGWVHVFLPYLRYHSNPFCRPYSEDESYVQEGLEEVMYKDGAPEKRAGIFYEDLPTGVMSIPLKWTQALTYLKEQRIIQSSSSSESYLSEMFKNDGTSEIPFQLRAGFLGVEQRDDGTVSPYIGSYIRYGSE